MILTHQTFKYRRSGVTAKQGYIVFPKRVSTAIGKEQLVSMIIFNEGEEIDYDDLKKKVADYAKFKELEKEVEKLKNEMFSCGNPSVDK